MSRTEQILSLIPGGTSCDPQMVADELREKMQEMERELEISKQSESLTRIENKQLREEICRLNLDLARQSEQADRHRVALMYERALAYRLAISITLHERDGGHVPQHQASALAAWKAARQ